MRKARRRRRATKFIDLGNLVGLDFHVAGGRYHLDARFTAEGDALTMHVVNLQPVEALATGVSVRRPIGIREVRRCQETVAGIAADAGYQHLRVVGRRRNHRRDHTQVFDIDLAGMGRG